MSDEHEMNVTETECENAIRDYLFMYYDISSDCLPVGDWDRANLGNVDPFRFIDLPVLECIITERQTIFLREASAVKMLCMLACIVDEDQCSGSTFVNDFVDKDIRDRKEEILRTFKPELFSIHDLFVEGKFESNKNIQIAFESFFSNQTSFYERLSNVLKTVIYECFAKLA